MFRGQKQNEADVIIKRAVELSRIPGSGSRTSGAGRGGGNHYNDLSTTDDGSGGTLHPFLLGVDSVGSDTAILRDS